MKENKWADTEDNGWDKFMRHLGFSGDKDADWHKEEERPRYDNYRGKRRWGEKRNSHKLFLVVLLALMSWGVYSFVKKHDISIGNRNNELVEKNSDKRSKTEQNLDVAEVNMAEDVAATDEDISASSNEKSISELLEESTHASVVEQAKQAGVSTEGSTSEILERITHADVVKQAKQAGVSTEGSTSEILERITHASVVKQAKQEGVSTEGTTSEILERITRKSLEKLR